ncbi:DUF3500 domain-containing protein [Anatilimnocola floriformis]|uniref:DUF3500 domain-containing protein n=1 Tax=Anatilimnocola floriformis TaxID=2948575 RepID=UPI0020C26676|nr:DUF3500 domain-containing protein [Anatilimnocola floriformis]
MNLKKKACPDCEVDRRDFLRAVGGVALATAAAPLLTSSVFAAPSPKSAAETVAAELFKSLSAEQRKAVCFDFDHDLRKKINANWHITKQKIDDPFYTKEQKAQANEIVKRVCSEDGYQRLLKQTEYDDGGVGAYSMAFFGNPDSGKFQWTLTGRHLTLRADGDSVDKAAFGGPLIYGHGEENPKENLYLYQTQKTNEVFKALDPKQAEKALLANAPGEDKVQIQGASGKFPGVGVSELSSDQQELVEDTLKVLLAPYRAEDADEVMAMLKADGGVSKLHMAFYQTGDLGQDKTWDIWRVEGPSFVWHFRGAPHVHAYINIAAKA